MQDIFCTHLDGISHQSRLLWHEVEAALTLLLLHPLTRTVQGMSLTGMYCSHHAVALRHNCASMQPGTCCHTGLLVHGVMLAESWA